MTSKAHRARETWCLWTKEQGFAGSEAPRPVRRRRFGPERRGTSPDPNPLFSRNERSRCIKCTAASFIYYAFLDYKFKSAKPPPLGQRPAPRTKAASPAAPRRPGNAHAARRSPRRSAAPRKSGSASPSPAKPSPLRRSLQIGEARASHPTSAAVGCAP